MGTRVRVILVMAICAAVFATAAFAQLDTDVIKTAKGDLKIAFLGHASLMFAFNGKHIYLDPVGDAVDYSKMPKADMIFITHAHGDHLNVDVIEKLLKKGIPVMMPQECADKIGARAMEAFKVVVNPGVNIPMGGVRFSVVPAYNIVHKRPNGQLYHPKGSGYGYVIDFAGTRVYVAGDTENTPEMKALKDIDAAFLPMNLPYTMTEEMVADAAKAFQPKILYPYHSKGSDTKKLIALLKDEKGIDVRVKKIY